MLKQYATQLKNYNFYEKLQEGYFVDAKDQNRWKVAQVKSVSKYGMRITIQLRFDGFSAHFNENFDLPSAHKLAPFRKYSLPYTGPPYQSRREQYKNGMLEKCQKSLNKFLVLDKLKPQWINQALRGDLFIFVDSILTKRFIQSQTEFTSYLTFLVDYIKHGSNALVFSVQYLKELEKQPIIDPNFIYVHPKLAILFSCTELLFNFNSMISKSQRRIQFHRSCQKYHTSAQIMKIFRQVMVESNVPALCEKLLNFKGVRGLPWSIKKEALILLNSLSAGYAFPTFTDNRQALEVLDYMNYFYSKGVFNKQDLQRKTIELVIGLIINGNFQGKLRGLNEMKKMVENTLYRSSRLVEQINNKRIISILIDNNSFNIEVFKRSLPIFEFAFKNNLVSMKELTQILNLHKDKHQLELQAFYSCIAEFASFLDGKTTVQFFKEITNLPVQENMINLVRDYTLTTVEKNQYFKRKYMKDGEEGLGMTYFWNNFTSQTTPLSTNLKNKMIEAFASLLGKAYYDRQVEKIIILSLKGIQQRKNTECYLKVIHETLKISKKINKAIQTAERQINIIESVVGALNESKTISDQMLQSTFEFLQEVTFASKRKITINQIKQLWKLKNCRNYLLKFLRKYRLKDSEFKNHQKIIYKQLDPVTIRQIIQKIFLDNTQINYQCITQDEYQTGDELIISYNHSTQALQYNYKHTIRTKYPQKLYGLEFYVNLINQCNQKEIVEKALKRYIQFYLRAAQNIKTDIMKEKMNLWTMLTVKLSKFNKNALAGYKIFLEDIEGRMKSLSILDDQVINVVVSLKSSQEKSILTLQQPRFTSLWKLRNDIAAALKISQTNFDMHLASNYTKTNFQKEEDFSVSLITQSKQTGNAHVIINLSKERHPHHIAIENFKKVFAELTGQELYNLLQDQSKVPLIYQILNMLPFIKKIQDKYPKLNVNDKNEIIETRCMGKLGYQLKIINAKFKNPVFALNMIEKGYIHQMSKIFITKSNFSNYPVLIDAMSYMIDLVKFWKSRPNIPHPFDQNYLIEMLSCPIDSSPQSSLYLIKVFSLLKQLQAKIKISIIFQSKSILPIFQSILFSASQQKVVADNIFEISKNAGAIQSSLSPILNKLMNYQFLVTKQYACKPFFDLIVILIQKKQANSIMPNLKKTLKTIRNADIYEKEDDKVNCLLQGFAQTMLSLIKSKENVEDILDESIESFADFIINGCLFNVNQPTKVKFKSAPLRENGFALLQYIDATTKGNHKLSSILKQLMVTGTWRKQYDWNISPTKLVQKQFTGLKNLAATCYINSLLQQLLFVQTFSNQILDLDATQIDDKENIVLQIQNIFAHLKFSESPVYTTASLCKTFILDGQPIDPRIQTDVDQFFHSLMDKLERNLLKINKKQIINDTFGGQFSNLIIGQQCNHTSQRIQHFLSIRLQIKNKSTLDQALNDFIKGQILEGQNSYFCQRCDKKVKAQKRVCLKTLPEVLIITLKRFQFDYDTMQKFKLNTFCSFPQKMNFLPYTRDGIQNDHEVNPTDYEYELKGVVIHYGISQAGHYTSYIKTNESNWNYFDDEKIYEFDPKELKAECFGGIEENPFGEDEEKKKNAYLLFYEKVQKARPDIKVNLAKTKIYQQIQEQNRKTKFVNMLFQPNLQNYIFNISSSDPTTYLIYYHTVFLRNYKKKEKADEFYSKCIQILTNKEYANWYIHQINEAFVLQFLIYAESSVKAIVTSLLMQAASIASFDIQFLHTLIFFINRKGNYPMIKLFSALCKGSKQYEKSMSSINFAQATLAVIKAKDIKPTFFNPLKVRRDSTEFGSQMAVYHQRNTDFLDLFQAIQMLKLNLSPQDIQSYLSKIQKPRTQKSVALIIARRYSDLNDFTQFVDSCLDQWLIKMEVVCGDEFIFSFVLQIVQQFVVNAGNDPNSQKKIRRLAQSYVNAMKQSIYGYKAELMLLSGLFRICSLNLYFRDCICDIFADKEEKKSLKAIKDWIRDIVNFFILVKQSKIAYFRNKKTNVPLSFLQNEKRIQVDKLYSSLNAVIQKHNVQQVAPDAISLNQIVLYGQGVKYEYYSVVKINGLLLQLHKDDQRSNKIVFAQDVTPYE